MAKKIVPVPVVIAVAAALLIGCHRKEAVSEMKAAPRDVILVTIDTLRADSLGFAGKTEVKTPFLDSLAARGIVFMNAHAHNVITLPSHVNILTGLYPFQHGVRENAGFTLDPKTPTVATLLKPLGYSTGAFVGAFPLDARFGLNQGFDEYDDNYGKGQSTVDFVVPERQAEAVLKAATAWWQSHDHQKRFMWVHLYDPHAPYDPPEPFHTEYRGNEYLGEIAYVDSQLAAQLGPILQADPDALVIVTGDHGEALGDHGELTHGLFAYESTLKIPLIVAGGGLAHRVENGYVRHVDIVPTILAATGAHPPPNLRGAPLTAAIGSRDSYFESLSASLNRGWAPLTGIIHNSEKYIDLPIPELYDLPHDPKETNNLRAERRRDVEAARALLVPMRVEPGTRTVDADTIAKLRSLGYISGSGGGKKTFTEADDPKNLVGLDNKLHEAIDAFERHQPQRALELARALVAERPDMIAGREIYAFMLQENEQVPEAIRQLETIVQDPNANVDNYDSLALLYCETGHPDKAITLLQPHASGKDPDLLNAYGVAFLDMGRFADADRVFQNVLTIDPNNAPALQNLGISALRRDDRARAMDYLNRALTLNPRLPNALNTLGVAYADAGQFAEAVDYWNRAVAVDPRQYDALFNIALVETRAGHREEAKRALAQFIRTAPRARYGPDIDKATQALAALH
ncbi:MAG TPA: sulfatase-like hydrolase/transferase [Thermoanaerobaculia bacterium]|jgi:arylsulfatase A-like enzyme/tetratricopeptide (TPR) repeat protein